MSDDITTRGPDDVEPVWGEASSQRGLSHLQQAIEFVTDHPIGTRLSAADFDQWAQRHGLLNLPVNAPKNSDAWKAHLMRRHELRYRINRSGAHPRLREQNATPFSLDKVQTNLYEVRAPHASATLLGIPNKVASLVDTNRKKLSYLLQSADWDVLPPYERMVAESLYDDIDGFSDDVHSRCNRLDHKFSKLQARLKRAIDLGEIKPRNHGIQQLLTKAESEEDDHDETQLNE
jgi:hypothetical protein